MAHAVGQTNIYDYASKEENLMIIDKRALAAAAACAWLASATSAHAQTTLTMSSWVSPAHHLTGVVLAGFGEEIEKASGGPLHVQILPQHPAPPPRALHAVRARPVC